MMQCNLKKMTVVPSGKDLVDIVLSWTQRQTPTVVHKGYAISLLRQFYMRKVKFTYTTFHDKLSTIIDDIHPFYSDLHHGLYNKDHYKLAHAQVNTIPSLIGRDVNDYVRLLKFNDSLYLCKSLKVAALGQSEEGQVSRYIHGGRVPALAGEEATNGGMREDVHLPAPRHHQALPSKSSFADQSSSHTIHKKGLPLARRPFTAAGGLGHAKELRARSHHKPASLLLPPPSLVVSRSFSSLPLAAAAFPRRLSQLLVSLALSLSCTPRPLSSPLTFLFPSSLSLSSSLSVGSAVRWRSEKKGRKRWCSTI
ncbi:Nucleolar GTP-binding protein 1 [Nymphaea thermarum]|nr:Nucleolar GTP-binding protein 1 [Nymphaea thermarum]